jgi:hypothetical protein
VQIRGNRGKLEGSQEEGNTLKEHSDDLSERAVRAFGEGVQHNVGKFRDVMDRQELNIDKIEALWRELRVQTEQVIKELYTELVGEILEKELIVKKAEIRAEGIEVRNGGK